MDKVYINGQAYMTPEQYSRKIKRTSRMVYYMMDTGKVKSEVVLGRRLIPVE